MLKYYNILERTQKRKKRLEYRKKRKVKQKHTQKKKATIIFFPLLAIAFKNVFLYYNYSVIIVKLLLFVL